MQALNQKPKTTVSWSRLYYFVSCILNFARLNYFSENFCNSPLKKVLMFGIFIFQMFVALVCLAGVFLPNDYKLEDNISCLIIFFTEASIGSKVVTLIYYSKTLKKLSDIILAETSRDYVELWEIELAQKYYGHAKLICFKIIFLYSVAMLNFIILPLILNKGYDMPILLEFPGTDRFSYPGYEINYLIGAYGVFYGTLIEMGFDIPAFLQACFIAFQFDRCGCYCKMIGDFDTVYNTQEKQSKLLKKCIKLHASIFKFINEMATINTSVVALTVITSFPLLTCLLYSLLLGTVSTSPCMMVASVYHLFMYCFMGEVVSAKCREASQAVYNSQWYKIENIDDRRTFLFFLNVSQCDMKFSARGLYKLSLETFSELIKRVYGTCAFLKEVI